MKKRHLETAAIHAGQGIDPATGSVAQPIYPSTTFERDMDGGYQRGYQYTRSANPNRASLETCMAELENGNVAAAFSSGMAAIHAVFQALKPGDHIIVPDDMYYGVKVLTSEIFDRWQLQISAVDMTDLKAVAAAISTDTRLIWCETPSNPQLKITDIAALAALAKQHDILLGCDNTWCSPIITRPLELGADVVMHSATKYISGHSDVLGGILVSDCDENDPFWQRIRGIQKEGGAVPAPMDCWLTLRGIQTLPLRVAAQSERAQIVAQWLVNHPKVTKVHYPGLKNHPQWTIAQQQMALMGGMLSFEIGDQADAAIAMTNKVKMIVRATSLGGTHSLIEHRRSIEGDMSTTPAGLLRLSVGLEHVEDIIADLEQALA